MKRELILIGVILLLFGSIIAAGSSTGSNTVSESDSNTETSSETNNRDNTNKSNSNTVSVGESINIKNNSRGQELKENLKNVNLRLIDEAKRKSREACEDVKVRKERIKCRLRYIRNNKEEFISPIGVIPESCRGIVNKEVCRQLYEKSQQCYEKHGLEKNKCFKRIAGFARAKLKDENPANRNNLSRTYVILLLYNLQEKIEKGIEDDRIDVDKGTEAIDKIVEIKEAILNGKAKNDIKPLFQDLKKILSELKEEMDKDE